MGAICLTQTLREKDHLIENDEDIQSVDIQNTNYASCLWRIFCYQVQTYDEANYIEYEKEINWEEKAWNTWNLSKEAFNFFDKNCDGYICSQDFEGAIDTLGFKDKLESVESFKSFLSQRKQECIDFDQFMEEMRFDIYDEPVLWDLNTVKRVFSIIDSDGDGYVTSQDLCHKMNLIGFKISASEANIMIQDLDYDKDGKIDFRDFILLTSTVR